MSSILSVDDIKEKSRDAQSEVVHIESLGGSIRVCPMSPGDADTYHQANVEDRRFGGQVPIVYSCVVEPEFESADQVADMDYTIVNDIFMAIMSLGDASVEEAEKNSAAMSG